MIWLLPTMVPSANAPTAMEAITSRLRARLSQRSANTLRQRGLSAMAVSPVARCPLLRPPSHHLAISEGNGA